MLFIYGIAACFLIDNGPDCDGIEKGMFLQSFIQSWGFYSLLFDVPEFPFTRVLSQ
jgi:hypothetical protein